MKNILLCVSLLFIVVVSLVIYNGHKEAVAEDNAKNKAAMHMARIYPEFEISVADVVFDRKGNKYDVVFRSVSGEERRLVYNPHYDSIHDSHLNYIAEQYTREFAGDSIAKSNRMKELLQGNYNIDYINYNPNLMDPFEVYEKYKQGIPLEVSVGMTVHLEAVNNNILTQEEFEEFVWKVIILQRDEEVVCTGLQVKYYWHDDYQHNYFNFEFSTYLQTLECESVSDHVSKTSYY